MTGEIPLHTGSYEMLASFGPVGLMFQPAGTGRVAAHRRALSTEVEPSHRPSFHCFGCISALDRPLAVWATSSVQSGDPGIHSDPSRDCLRGNANANPARRPAFLQTEAAAEASGHPKRPAPLHACERPQSLIGGFINLPDWPGCVPRTHNGRWESIARTAWGTSFLVSARFGPSLNKPASEIVFCCTAAWRRKSRRENFPGDPIQLPDLHGKLWKTWANVHSAKFRRQLGRGIGDMLCLRHYRALFDEVALRVIPSRRVWCVSNSEHYRLEFEIVQRRFSGDVEVPRPAPTGDKTVCEDLLCHQRLLEAWKEGPVGIATVVPRLSVSALRQQNTLVISPFASDPIRHFAFRCPGGVHPRCRQRLGSGASILTPPTVVAKYESLARRLAEKGCQVTVRVTRTVDELIEALALVVRRSSPRIPRRPIWPPHWICQWCACWGADTTGASRRGCLRSGRFGLAIRWIVTVAVGSAFTRSPIVSRESRRTILSAPFSG